MFRVDGVACLLAALSVTAPVAAQADDELAEARVLFERAAEDYEANRFEDALRGFERVYEITANADVLYNVGRTLERLRRDDEALVIYQRYLDMNPEGSDRSAVEARVTVLRRVVSERDAESEPGSPPDPIAEPEPEPIDNRGPAVEGIVLASVGGALIVTGAILLGAGAADFATVQSAEMGSVWDDFAPIQDRAGVLTGIGVPFLVVGTGALIGGIVWALGDGGGEVAFGPGSVRFRRTL